MINISDDAFDAGTPKASVATPKAGEVSAPAETKAPFDWDAGDDFDIGTPTAVPKACSIDNPDCEACQ